MDEYAALAQRVALTLGDVRGCLVLSRDGLVLGAYPEEHESDVQQAWLRFVQLGEPRKGFVDYGDQIWAYVVRGPYASFVVSGASARPGVLLDLLEQMLLTAEESRTRKDTLKVPDAAAAPSGKPRTTLHPAAERGQAVGVGAVPPVDPLVAAATPDGFPPADPPSVDTHVPPLLARHEAPGDGGPTSAEAPVVPTALKREPQRLVSSGWVTGEDVPGEGGTEAAEIDRVLLAKEFSGLLQVDDGGDEGSS